MENYKIKVNNEAESREAQELFFELGYCWNTGLGVKNLDAKFLYAKNNTITMGYYSDSFSDSGSKQLTLPQLRDIVVLHRNDVKDANFKLFISPSQGCLSLYKASDDVFYVYADKSKCWDKSRSVGIKNKDLEPIQDSKKDEQGLISGADALRALADGREVEFLHDSHGWVNCLGLNIEQVISGLFKLRLKPRTITLNVEIPAPFEPKEGEEYFLLNPFQECGYDAYIFDSNGCDHIYVQFGAWRTEEEIKKVVAALRGGVKA